MTIKILVIVLTILMGISIYFLLLGMMGFAIYFGTTAYSLWVVCHAYTPSR